MFSQGPVIVLLSVLCVVTHGCIWNDCLCTRTKIICDRNNRPDPSFSPYERQFVKALIISSRQVATLITNCADFRRLDYVEIKDLENGNNGYDQCPKTNCQGVTVVCM